MKMLLCLFCLALFTTTFAQSKDLVDDQLQRYEVKFKNLMATRGLSYKEGKVNQRKIKEVIEEYSKSLDGKAQPITALLFYHFENDTLYHWLFDSSGLTATALLQIKADSLIALENTLKFSLQIDDKLSLATRSKNIYLNKNKKYRLKTQQSIPLISALLFPSDIAAGLRNKKHLIILPILNLSSFPYSILKPWGEEKGMLIDSLSYSFAHNFTQFFQSVENNDMGYQRNYKEGHYFLLKNPLICGNPSFTDSCTNRLTTLPGAEREAKAIAAQLKVKALYGDAAIKNSIVSSMESSNFIYLATHGWADSESPLDKSFIALHQPNGCGLLTPREIQFINLKEKPIVVLSACQSGLGMIHEAGIIGLARGFLKAGAQSVMMSLWNVNDDETEKLMRLFMEELNQPHLFFPAEHWRQAVLKYRKEENKNILNWSAFQTFGVPYRLHGEISIR